MSGGTLSSATHGAYRSGDALVIGVGGWRAPGIAYGTRVTVLRRDAQAYGVERYFVATVDGRHAYAYGGAR
jgi:hypothetical protein